MNRIDVPINPEIKEQWVDALRSERYYQGREMLRQSEWNNTKVMCCLGVLCDIVQPNAWKKEQLTWYHNGCDNMPGGQVSQLAGTTRIEGVLSALNDNEGFDFEEIATIIENDLFGPDIAGTIQNYKEYLHERAIGVAVDIAVENMS